MGPAGAAPLATRVATSAFVPLEQLLLVPPRHDAPAAAPGARAQAAELAAEGGQHDGEYVPALEGDDATRAAPQLPVTDGLVGLAAGPRPEPAAAQQQAPLPQVADDDAAAAAAAEQRKAARAMRQYEQATVNKKMNLYSTTVARVMDNYGVQVPLSTWLAFSWSGNSNRRKLHLAGALASSVSEAERMEMCDMLYHMLRDPVVRQSMLAHA